MTAPSIPERAAEQKAAPIYHPILFSAPMVRANREGRKTMTRRVMKLPGYDGGHVHEARDGRILPVETFCPYGVPGDRLWVRERMRVIEVRSSWTVSIRVRYEADGAESDWLPYPERLKGEPVVGKCLSYGGYREASRDTLVVTAVRAERLQDITEEDALAEGIRCIENTCFYGGEHIEYGYHATDPYANRGVQRSTARDAFRNLWDSINASRGYGFDVNPFVWVVSFRRLEGGAL